MKEIKKIRFFKIKFKLFLDIKTIELTYNITIIKFI